MTSSFRRTRVGARPAGRRARLRAPPLLQRAAALARLPRKLLAAGVRGKWRRGRPLGPPPPPTGSGDPYRRHVGVWCHARRCCRLWDHCIRRCPGRPAVRGGHGTVKTPSSTRAAGFSSIRHVRICGLPVNREESGRNRLSMPTQGPGWRGAPVWRRARLQGRACIGDQGEAAGRQPAGRRLVQRLLDQQGIRLFFTGPLRASSTTLRGAEHL